MIYPKPKIRHVDMCIFIDKNIRSDDPKIQEKCFEYLWHMYYILAVKQKMFESGRDYDEYALYSATQLYLRYQKEKDPDYKRKLKPIKSCLNYIKRTLYPFKVNYSKMTFQEEFRAGSLNGENPLQIQEDRVNAVRKENNDLMEVEYKAYLNNICSSVRMVLNSSPYKKDKQMMHNLYLSCLLTILKTITISNKNKARIQNKTDKVLPIENLVDQIYAEESKDNIIVWHLDKAYSNYIATLVNKIKKEIAKDLRYIIGSFEPPDALIKDLLISPLEEIVGRKDKEDLG